MNPSARDNCSRACGSVASGRRNLFQLPSPTHWKLRWQVSYGDYLLGSARHWAAVPSPHKTPLSTARVSRQHGRRSSLCRAGCRIASKTGVMHLWDRF